MRHPSGWKVQSLEDVAEVQTGLSKSSSRIGAFIRLPYLRVANVQAGRIDLSEVKEIDVPRELVARYSVMPGDLLLTEGGDADKLGRGALWSGEIRQCVHQNHVFVVRADPRVLDRRFLALQTQSHYGRAYFLSCSKQSTNLASINSTQLKEFPVLVPTLEVQRKIADILGTWDEALEKLDALIAAKERRNRALMQQLLWHGLPESRKRRPALIQLAQVATARAVRNGNRFDRSRLFAVTKAEGMVPMRERVQGATVDRCKVVEHGWFAYNPMRLNIGSIARWEGREPVMVSGDYVVFSADESRLLSDYLNHIRRSDAWSEFVGGAGNGSVRVRIWFDDLGHFRFPLPSVTDQRRIAAILDKADSEIRLLRMRREQIELQKRGLMQHLFVGRTRVRV